MPKTYLNPPALFDSVSVGFSQGVLCEGGKTLYLAGQVGWNNQRQLTDDGSFQAQVDQTFINIDSALKAAGGTFADVVSMRIYVVESEMHNGTIIRDALQKYFMPKTAPVTTWLGISCLASEELLIEIEVTAVIE